ncbi:hypothetical protein AWQ21_01310 [Picosynechococcus sp. PCC 7003]|uniref:DUF3120 domain-containing protein n=1 Tax=Picosynechococcus sp. PCC 7003 TaxID=374981 RepID=UPI0008108EEC|nr:hypothetical protein AWQ21_01310 [Picosynechococcus sp. PCC 7003]
MLNHPLFSVGAVYVLKRQQDLRRNVPLLICLASGFLVSVPVFFQAPLVRTAPWLSLALTLLWVAIAFGLRQRENTEIWGDLLWGFSWSWLAGAIYWGWLRYEPFLHLPVEAIGLPFALWGLWQKRGLVGHLFYLGSLLGTAITDIYFYLTDLIPYWRKLMYAEPDFVMPIFQAALAQMQTLWGISWAVVLVNLLIGISWWAFRQPQIPYWSFAGAVVSTLLVDGLFWIAACFA